MSCKLIIGNQLESSFLSDVRSLSLNAAYNEKDKISDKLNKALFNGGPSSPKSFGQLLSVENPSGQVVFKKIAHLKANNGTSAITWAKDGNSHDLVTVEKKASSSAKYALLEGIPVIGSILAIFGAIGHAYSMRKAAARLKEAGTAHLESNKKPHTKEAELEKAKQVFDAAIDYTSQRNYYKGSLLSLVPFLKPIVRLFQLASN
jgi:hypothetical protein